VLEAHYREWSETPDWQNDSVLNLAIATHLKHGKEWRVHMEWKDGLLLKIARQARDNKDKQFTVVLDNISAANDNMRLLLNPILWERMVEIRERGISLKLPSNLQFIMTMHKDTEIKDPSFMNRPLVQDVKQLDENDIASYLRNNFGFSDASIKRLIEIFEYTQKKPFSEDANIVFADILEIAKRVKGLSLENKKPVEDILNKEAFDYLYLRLKNTSDRAKLTSEMFSGLAMPPVKIWVDPKKGMIDFDGVELTASEEIIKLAEGNPGAFKDVMRKAGYIAEETEERVLAQLARQYKYGNKAVQLEGPSGEGKTEVGRIFASVVKLNLQEYTVNEDTDLAELRGKLRPAKDGRYELTKPAYLKNAEKGGNVFLFNEINTSENSALYYWLYPEIAQRPQRHLTEFADSAENELTRILRINQNNLWLFTVNPQSFKGRNITPPIITSFVPCFQMASDIETLPQKIKSLFSSEGLESYSNYAKKLAAIHKNIREKKLLGKILSPQDITPREYLEVVRKFKTYLQSGKAQDEAFSLAVKETYLYMWQFMDDIRLVQQIIEKEIPGKKTEQANKIMTDLLKQNKRPLLIFYNAVNDIRSLVESIKKSDEKAIIVDVPISYFHNGRQFLGGLIPRETAGAYTGDWEPLNNLSPLFDEKLGILPELIKKARFEKGKNVYAVFSNYTHLNSQTAPLLNEFLQTGRIENLQDKISKDIIEELFQSLKKQGRGLWLSLRKEYGKEDIPGDTDLLGDEQKRAFALWFYGQKPDNLRVIATGSSQEPTRLSVAEINRFQTVNVSEDMSESWIINYIKTNLPGQLKPYIELINDLAVEAFKLYEAQKEKYLYGHNRLSADDFKALINELKNLPEVNEERIKETAYYVLGIGLRTEYRDQLSFNYSGKDSSFKLTEDKRFLSPTRTLTHQIASLEIALRNKRIVIIEGFPGGGKTSSVEDLAARKGLPFYKDMMYEDIDLRGFLGSLTKEGGKYLLTATQKDNKGKYLLQFLRAYSGGGLYLLDEGAIGVNSQEVISYLAELALAKEIDLGTFHPGLAGNIIKKNEDFHLIIAQNPAGTTSGREPIPYNVDTIAHKIWTDNILTLDDAVKIIDYYLDEPQSISPELKRSLARIHLKFTEEHPNKEEISPRQLIMISKVINKAFINKADINWAVFEGIIAGYLTRVDEENFDILWSIISKLTDGKLDHYLSRWGQPINIERGDSSIRFNGTTLPLSSTKSNVTPQEIEIFEKLPSRNKILREIALGISLNMPVALLEEEGT
ncbi:MAG: AAA family ATPase, partial [Candidatus Omnitrophica bacterium]|nr:AAA family ATPase [Candidatus Omnitrophota bacterium]